MNEIENWYDNEYDEWARLDRHKVEYEITILYFNKYITGNNLDILDIGGGPGRYSFFLANQDHNVTLLDLSQHNIDVAKEKSRSFGITLNDYIKGDALELNIHNQKYDVILLMGPLYHLIKETDRKKVVENAYHLLKNDGIIIASFISKYAPIQDCLSYLEFAGMDSDVNDLLCYLKDGENKEGLGFTTAYFTGIEEAKALMSENHFEELAFAGVENILGSKEQEILSLSEKDIQKWLDLCFALSEDETLYGTSQHFLYVGKKL